MLMWNKYRDKVIFKIGRINSIAWRNKNIGWHDLWCMCFDNDKVKFKSLKSKGGYHGQYSTKAEDLFFNKRYKKTKKYIFEIGSHV